jgi:ComEC/Rec2-related protein
MIRRLRHWAASNPLARLALAALAGILVVDWCGLAARAPVFACLGALSLAAAFFRPSKVPLEVPVFLVFGLAQCVRMAETGSHWLRAKLVDGGRADAVVIAHISHLAVEEYDNPTPVREARLEARSILLRSAGLRVDGEVTLRGWVRRPRADLVPGDYELQGTLRLPGAPTNPGQFDTGVYLAREGFACDLDVRGLRLVKAEAIPVRAWFLNAAQACRGGISAALSRGLEGEARIASIIRTMALGTQTETDPEVERPFKETGTLHIFAVSGLHVGLVSVIGFLFLRPFGLPRPLASLLLIAGVFAYAFITGWTPSAARAAIMVAVFLAATLLARQSRLQNSLGASMLVLLATDPQRVFLPGFQLSFFVLWAIAVLTTPLLHRLRRFTELDPFLPPSLATRWQQWWAARRLAVAKTLCVSFAAWAGSTPLMLWHFKIVTPVALIANSVLVPLSFLVLSTAFLTVLASVAGLAGGQVLLNNANWLWARLLLWFASFFAGLPGSHFTAGLATEPRLPAAAVTVFHLPFGEAAAHVHAGAQDWLLDTGSAAGFTRIVQPALQSRGVDVLDGLILSHSDIEHVGGAARARDDLGTRAVTTGHLEPWRYESGATSLKRLLARADIAKRFSREGDSFDLGGEGAPVTMARILYPGDDDKHDKADDRALVVRLDIGAFRLLFCGDIGFCAEKALLERHSAAVLQCDVLIRNNHASDISGLEEFLLAAAPRAVVSSNVSAIAEERMPASVRRYCERAGAALFELGESGAVTMALEGGRLVLRGFASGKTVSLLPRP